MKLSAKDESKLESAAKGCCAWWSRDKSMLESAVGANWLGDGECA